MVIGDNSIRFLILLCQQIFFFLSKIIKEKVEPNIFFLRARRSLAAAGEGRRWPASSDGKVLHKVRPNFDSDKLWAEPAQANLIFLLPLRLPLLRDKKMNPHVEIIEGFSWLPHLYCLCICILRKWPRPTMAFGCLEHPRMVTLERLLLDHDLWVFRLYAYLHDVRNDSTSAQ